MKVKAISNIPFYFFKNLLRHKDIAHFVSTRQGGMSEGVYESLNIEFNTDDNPENVLKNREIMAGSLGIPLGNFVSGKQVHSDHTQLVGSHDKGRGANDYESAFEDTDAFVTNKPGICLMIRVADCVPILLFDPKNNAISAVHAGWRGSMKLIAGKAVGLLYGYFKSRPGDIIAGIGPSIGPCCYEVGQEVIEAVESIIELNVQTVLTPAVNGKMHLDLWELNKWLLLRAGLKEENIKVAGICTKDHSDVFFSSRASSGDTGRFAAGIMIKD